MPLYRNDDEDGDDGEGNDRGRAPRLYIGTVVLLVGLIVVAYVAGLERADKLASLFSALLAVVTLVYTYAENQRARRKSGKAGKAKHRSGTTKMAVTATVTATVAFSCGSNVASAPDDRYSPYECDIAAGAPGTITPRPRFAAGLVFCPLEVNDGIVAIEGESFSVTGQILGPRPEGRNLVLFVRIDPETCDTRGRAGGPGRFPLEQVDLGAADDGWSYSDDFGNYPEGITFGRHYEFALVSPALAQRIRDTAKQWEQSGIADEELRAPDFASLSAFDVPPGVSKDAVPCD